MARLRVGLIGTGSIATGAHLPAMMRLPDHVELVAVADVRPEAAETARNLFGAEAAYTDYHELLARPDIDMVDICTPEFLHREQVSAAAAAGKHVLCEKPMAMTPAECDAMLDACRQAGVRLMIAHSRRFTPRYMRIREALDRGEIGEVRFVRENERRPIAFPTAPPDPVEMWRPEDGGDDARPWTARKGFTHGAASTNAVHEMDLLRWFAGSEPVAILAEERITNPRGEVPDFFTCLIRFENGTTAATEIVNRLPPDHPQFHMIEVIGSDGSIRAFDSEMSPMTLSDGGTIRHPEAWAQLLHVDVAYENEIRAFVEALRDDKPVPMDPWEARQALAMSFAAVESSRSGQWVAIDTPGAGR